jgi:hypothetical protein
MYVCISYSSISAGRPFTYLPRKPQLVYPVTYLHQTEFCILTSLAIWLRSSGGSVAVAVVGLTLLQYSIKYSIRSAL